MLMMPSVSPFHSTVCHLGSWGGYGGWHEYARLSIVADIIWWCCCAEPLQIWMMLATSEAKPVDNDVDVHVSSLLGRLSFRELWKLRWMMRIQYDIARKK